ncbi:hypothetical protein MAJ_10124, partial [Metarhizium majus ARSEF 297]
MEFIREYGIASKVRYFMMDNASNMNTMIDRISDDLEHEFDVFYDPLPHRLCCVGHIICLRDGRKATAHYGFLLRTI